MFDKINALPNAFYDLIVFSVSTVIFAIGLFIGLGIYNTYWYRELETINYIFILIGIIFGGYEYGRIAEAWSAIIVQRPLKFLHSHNILLKNKDFLVEIKGVEEYFNSAKFQNEREGGKWFIYFYSSLVSSKIGLDLMKRYAWEKLSRNSAFTFCMLFISSISIMLYNIIFKSTNFNGNWVFGSIEYTLISFVMLVFTYYEYYRRNSWNNDLLIKAMPVLKIAKQMIDDENRIEINIDGEKVVSIQMNQRENSFTLKDILKKLFS